MSRRLISAVVHMHVMQEWQAAGVEQLRLSTVDLTGVPTLENLHRGVDFALKHWERGNSVYVHCKAGRSRSATLVAAYLIKVSFKNMTTSLSTIVNYGCTKLLPWKHWILAFYICAVWSPWWCRPAVHVVSGLILVLSCKQLHRWTPEEACQKLALVRPHVLVRSAQMEMLRRYHQQVCTQPSWTGPRATPRLSRHVRLLVAAGRLDSRDTVHTADFHSVPTSIMWSLFI